MIWFAKTNYVERHLGMQQKLERKNWDMAHGKGGKRVMSLTSNIRHIGEPCIPTLVGALQHNILIANVVVG